VAATGNEEGRLRRRNRTGTRLGNGGLEFRNPYPWMSQVEAMVHLELERRNVPFSWRYFDGDSVNMRTLMPDFAPEFTLREYKLVILIIGSFWGTLPGVLDVNALATSLLEFDGWNVVTLYETEIRQNVGRALDLKAPMLTNPAIKGPRRPNPYGNVDLMKTRRENLRQQALSRQQFKLEDKVGGAVAGRRSRRRRRFDESGSRRRFSRGG